MVKATDSKRLIIRLAAMLVIAFFVVRLVREIVGLLTLQPD